jgi:D-alanine transaminase
MPIGEAGLKIVMREVVRRNAVDNGIIYLQVTRGAAPREHAFPRAIKPTLVATAKNTKPPDPKFGHDGIAVITIPDIRWERCDIKSVALVANVLGKQQAREAGAYEAWQVGSDGMITEGTSTNAWIVTMDGAVVTRKADQSILRGVTRGAILDIIRKEGLEFIERPFSVAEAKAAREAFLTSTTAELLPVVIIDGAPVANGKPGLLSEKLRAAYLAHAGVLTQ